MRLQQFALMDSAVIDGEGSSCAPIEGIVSKRIGSRYVSGRTRA